MMENPNGREHANEMETTVSVSELESLGFCNLGLRVFPMYGCWTVLEMPGRRSPKIVPWMPCSLCNHYHCPPFSC